MNFMNFMDAMASIAFGIAILIYLCGAVKWVVKKVRHEDNH